MTRLQDGKISRIKIAKPLQPPSPPSTLRQAQGRRSSGHAFFKGERGGGYFDLGFGIADWGFNNPLTPSAGPSASSG